MSGPRSHFLDGSPRLHYLEWNPQGRETLVLVHGSSANAWWWRPLADTIDPARYRLLALDQRGHGDSEWVRPAAYTPVDYARDLARFIEQTGLVRPIVAGHSMGGISVLAFAAGFGALARAAIAIDVALTSTPRRDRFLTRLTTLPVILYPDRATAIDRFRLMPDEGVIPSAVLTEIARHSVQRAADGRYSFKFDRASFIGSDGIDVLAAVKQIQIATLLIRAELSRIMTVEAVALAAHSNSLIHQTVIHGAHHHVPLECPGPLAQVIEKFTVTLGGLE